MSILKYQQIFDIIELKDFPTIKFYKPVRMNYVKYDIHDNRYRTRYAKMKVICKEWEDKYNIWCELNSIGNILVYSESKSIHDNNNNNNNNYYYYYHDNM